MIDCANYGDILSQSSSDSQWTCGLVCSLVMDIIIENCVNNGTLKGVNVYGISKYIERANNVVSAGTVDGSNEVNMFWGSVPSTQPYIYGTKDKCFNKCDGSVVLFAMNRTDGQYHTVDSDNDLVYSLLNNEADRKGYAFRWDHNLFLRQPINVPVGNPVNQVFGALSGASLEDTDFPMDLFDKYHLIPKGLQPSPSNECNKTTVLSEDIELVPYYSITIVDFVTPNGELNKTIFVKADSNHSFCENELKDYMDFTIYAVGDGDTRGVISTDDCVVSRNWKVVAMNRNAVVMDVDGQILAADVNVTRFASNISALTGIGIEHILVDLKVENGFVTQVTVITSSKEKSKMVVEALANLLNSGSCQPDEDLLCRVINPRVIVGEETLSSSNRIDVALLSLLLYFIMITVLH